MERLFEGQANGNNQDGARRIPTLGKYLVELWIFAVVTAFFIIRIFGSHFMQRIFAGFKHASLP